MVCVETPVETPVGLSGETRCWPHDAAAEESNRNTKRNKKEELTTLTHSEEFKQS